jgi:hypothetical protein
MEAPIATKMIGVENRKDESSIQLYCPSAKDFRQQWSKEWWYRG